MWKEWGFDTFIGFPVYNRVDNPFRGNRQKEVLTLADSLKVKAILDTPASPLTQFSVYLSTGKLPPRKNMLLSLAEHQKHPSFGGYLLFHEFYNIDTQGLREITQFYTTLGVPVFGVGNITYHLEKQPGLSEAFHGGIYLHEHYVNTVVRNWKDKLREWERVQTGGLQWGAIFHTGDELISEEPYLSVPSAQEFRRWQHTARNLGAKHFVCFPGSSGSEKDRYYVGLDHHPHLKPEIQLLSGLPVVREVRDFY